MNTKKVVLIEEKNSKFIKILCYGIYALITLLLAAFILYNSGWIIGDDAMVMRVTGWGHFFTPSYTTSPSTGRFYPFAYIIYNILPLLGLSSVNAHFALHSLVFVLFCAVSLWACYKAVDTQQLTWQDGVLVLSSAVVCIARAYSNFLDAFSTCWVDYTIIMIWALCCYYVHAKQSKTALVIGLISVTFLTFCMETYFIFPFSYGILGLLFTWKKSTKLEKTYFWSLIGVGVVFLLLYFFICFLRIEDAYDGAHGTEVTLISNAIKMFIAQKVLWLVLILVGWRAYRIFVKKEEYEFWDTILLTGCAYCCGCAVMKLNWVLYYSIASLFMVPAVVYYLHKYLGTKWTWIILLVLALFTFRKVPSYIMQNQKDRKESAETMEILVTQYKTGDKLYWYAPEDDREWCNDLEQRTWLFACLKSHFAWQINEEYYAIPIVETFDNKAGVYILPNQNNILFPNYNDSIISTGEVLVDKGARGFTIVKVQ